MTYTQKAIYEFGKWAIQELREHIGDDLHGGEAQDQMKALGILETIDVIEPCGEDCSCAEYGPFPQQCLMLTGEALATIKEVS